jgi:hypothetical protein
MVKRQRLWSVQGGIRKQGNGDKQRSLYLEEEGNPRSCYQSVHGVAAIRRL